MKKILLGAFALFAVMAVNAQVEVIPVDADAFGLTEDTELAKPTQIASSESGDVTVWLPITGSYKPTSLSYGLNVAGEDVEKVNGFTGSSSNPQPSGDILTGYAYPTEGEGIYAISPENDGYIYAIHKATYNKNYVVFEEQDRIPYYLSYYDSTNALFGEYNLFYGFTDVNAADDGSNVGAVASYWDDDLSEWMMTVGYKIQCPYIYDPNLTNAANGVSVIAFPVIGGLDYTILGTGTKMSLGYVIYSPTDDITITTNPTSEDETWGPVTIYAPGQLPVAGAGINNVTINLDSNDGKIYNISGQRLSSATKGINIVNGQKILVK